ncbi:hypothetical protein BUPH_05685 [Paraburkholderia phenoliruptrix BR3459a]|uniref:Uncharacterized protein n=1 Tax=Paraburkholderia phenoliruptrix BR3459a TaxID=1229205 RepID=K0DZA5_9BURK|nr:hypothetical protein BUPH_05685 [Paraburkholderia phenoliruptrix BR3459a]
MALAHTRARRTSNARRALSRQPGHQRPQCDAATACNKKSGLTLSALVLRRLLLVLLLLAVLLAGILRIARLCIGLLRIAHFDSF